MILCVSLGSLKKAYKGSKKMSIGQKLGQKKSCKKDVITLLVKVIRPFANFAPRSCLGGLATWFIATGNRRQNR